MTITTTSSQITYTGDGISTVFAYPFAFIAPSDLKVYLNGVLQTVGYVAAGNPTIGGSGTFPNGTVTFAPAPGIGVAVLLVGEPDQLQSTSLPPNDPFPSKTVEKMIDKLTLLVQRLFGKFARSIVAPDGESGTSLTLPAASVRAGNLLSFDSSGNVIVSAPVAGTATALAADLASAALATKNSGQIGFNYALGYGVGTIGRWLQDLATSAGSTFIGFLQAGAGAVQQTIQAVLRAQPKTPQQFGAVGDGVANDTAALQAWLDACYTNQVAGYLPKGTYLCTGLSKTFAGNRITQNLILYGDGRNSSIILQSGAPTQLILFAGSSPATGGNAAQIVMRDMGLQGVAKTCLGLTLDSVNDILLDNVRIEGFTDNLNLSSALLVTANKCQFANGNTGVKTRRHGTSSYCNSLAFTDCTFAGNSLNAGDFGAANNVIVQRAIVETCGTAANTATGPWIIRNTCDDETGFAKFVFEDCDYEQNQGRGLQAEAMSAGLDLEIRGGSFLTHATANDDIFIAGARRVRITGFRSVSAASVWSFPTATDQLLLENTKVGTLNDVGVTSPTYINAEANGTTYLAGKTSSFTATLTGCTTSPTGSVTWQKQGNRVRIRFPSITGTSNTTAATLTGMPAELNPAANRVVSGYCIDSGASKASQIVIGSAGTITLNNGTAVFTAAGTKGVDTCECYYDL